MERYEAQRLVGKLWKQSRKRKRLNYSREQRTGRFQSQSEVDMVGLVN